MKEFPTTFSVKNTDNFSDLTFERIKFYLRRELYEHVISHEEKDYFSGDDFSKKLASSTGLLPPTTAILKTLLKEVASEIEDMGWKCQLAFGGTALFVYQKEKPKNCWDGEVLS